MSEMHYWTKQEAMAFPQSPKIHLGTEGPDVSWKLQPRFHVCTNISVNRQHMAGNIAELAIYKKENYENIQPNAKTVNVLKKKKRKKASKRNTNAMLLPLQLGLPGLVTLQLNGRMLLSLSFPGKYQFYSPPLEEEPAASCFTHWHLWHFGDRSFLELCQLLS